MFGLSLGLILTDKKGETGDIRAAGDSFERPGFPRFNRFGGPAARALGDFHSIGIIPEETVLDALPVAPGVLNGGLDAAMARLGRHAYHIGQHDAGSREKMAEKRRSVERSIGVEYAVNFEPVAVVTLYPDFSGGPGLGDFRGGLTADQRDDCEESKDGG